MAKTFPAPSAEISAPTAAPAIPRSVGGSALRAKPKLSRDQARPFVLSYSGEVLVTEHGPLPRLIVHRCEGGAGGTRELRDGSYDISGLFEDLRQSGQLVLDWSLGYCVETEPNSGCYRPIWGTVKGAQIVEDEAAYRDWVQARVDDGTIPGLTREQVQLAADRYEAVLAQPTERGGHGLQVAKMRTQLEATRAALAVMP